MPANADNGQTIGASEVILFQSAAAGGSQRNGAMRILIANSDSSNALLVNSDVHHGDDEWMTVPPDSIIEIEVAHPYQELRTVKAKRAGSTDVTGVGWGINLMGAGTAPS